MNHILENENWTVKTKEVGAELTSIQNKSTGREYLWQGDPNVWAGQAPILFPIVGRLKNDQYRAEGSTYAMKQHGFARRSNFSVLEQNRQQLHFGLTADSKSTEMYPYNFVLDVVYQLQENEIKVTYTVTNKDQKKMPFSIGAHPAFAIPRIVDKQVREYHLIFSQPESLDRHFIENGLVSGETQALLDHEDQLVLHPKLFERDAIIFKGHQSEYVSLVCQNDGTKLVEMDVRGYPYLGIWQKAGAEYICIEPWYGIHDAEDSTGEIEMKEGIQLLEAGKSFECSYGIRLF